jgi:isocitrate dehydrogenase
LGEFLALAVSLEHLAERAEKPKAKVLSNCLDEATVRLLMTGKSPSRKVGELDNRGSHFFLALYWAEELSKQSADQELKDKFTPIAEELLVNRDQIVEELNSVQGKPVDLKGYFNPSEQLVFDVMRPSETFNRIMGKLRS